MDFLRQLASLIHALLMRTVTVACLASCCMVEWVAPDWEIFGSYCLVGRSLMSMAMKSWLLLHIYCRNVFSCCCLINSKLNFYGFVLIFKSDLQFVACTDTLTWMQPTVSGIPPYPRSLHTAVVVGNKLVSNRIEYRLTCNKYWV